MLVSPFRPICHASQIQQARLSVLIALLGIMAATNTRCSHGQTTGHPSVPVRPKPVEAQSFLPPGSPSDETAIATFNRMLGRAGGRERWSRIRSAKARYTSATPKGPREYLLLDDWSTDRVRYRRGMIGQPFAPADHDGNPEFKGNHDAHVVPVPEVDQGRQLIDHLPFAAAEVILRDKSYILRSVGSDDCKSQHLCIDVYRRVVPSGPFEREQEWRIDPVTLLPTTVISAMLQPGRSPSLWQELSFEKYETINGVSVPTSLVARLGGGMVRKTTLTEIQLGAAFDTVSFDQEVAR